MRTAYVLLLVGLASLVSTSLGRVGVALSVGMLLWPCISAAWTLMISRFRPSRLDEIEATVGTVREVLGAVEEEWDGCEVSELVGCGTKLVRKRYLSRVVNEARAHFPPMKRSQANTLVLDRWFRDTMREHGVRPYHIAQLKPLAVAAYYYRSKADVAAMQLAASAEMAEAEDAYQAAKHPYGWFGRWTGRAAVHTDV